ncbi:MAG: diacylglycerol kinase [Candidatus Binatia bacterium]|nr:diacylglycerol kinase [Candidatus Binatia bacterium]
MPYKVIQWSTGNVGRYALRAIIGHPELELVGVLVHSESKAGRDAGELAGISPTTGIAATNDVEAILATDADCVSYTATADLRPMEALADICRILESGKNVVSSSIVGLVHPRSIPEMSPKIEAACERGNSSFLTSGIDPGFANDALPLVLTGLAERWDQVRIQEIVNYANYDQPEVLFETMGFGKPMDHTPLLLIPGSLTFAWGGTIRVLAEGLGVELEKIEEIHERCEATKPIQIGDHTVEPGTMGALRFEVQGFVNGRPALIVEHVTRLDDDLAPEWATGKGGYRIFIEGVPRLECVLNMEDEHGDHAVGGVILTATRIVNAIPAVCNARTGPLSALDLPLITGRGLERRD